MKPHVFFLVICILIACSCNKDNSSTNHSVSLPKTYTEDVRNPSSGRTVVTYNVTYDANSRLLSLTAIPSPPILQFNYQYPTGNTLTMDLYNYGSLSIHEMVWLNSNGFIDSTFQFNDTNDSSTEKYVYNSSQQPIQLKDYTYHSSGVIPYNTTNYTYDNNGNTLTQTNIATGSVTYYTWDYRNRLTQTQLPRGATFAIFALR